MTRALRLKLDPIPAQEEGGRALIEGVRLSLTSFGKGRSKSKYNNAVAAKITFRIALHSTIRGNSEPERHVLGTLQGDLSVGGAEAAPLFIIKNPSKALTLEVPPESLSEVPPPVEDEPSAGSRARRPRPRVLPLRFDAATFSGVDQLKPSRLVIPIGMLDGFHYFELEASLELDSAEEGAFTVNDVLDGRITATSPPPLPAFDVLLVDDIGQPLEGVALRFAQGGREDVLTTDGTGFVRLPADEPGEATVTLDDAAALKKKLKPEWDKAHRGQQGSPPPADDHTAVFALRGDESPAAFADSELPLTVRVQPYVFLARLTGTFFDLNKTFLLPTAMGGLKDIRSVYDEQSPATLLVVGHTDTSGAPRPTIRCRSSARDQLLPT